MRRHLLAAVGACAAAVWVSAADGPAPTGTPAALTVQLGSERYDDREAAAKALEAAGPPAIPALQEAARGPNPEVARRAAEILAKLQRADDTTKRLAPRTVRLAYQDVPLGAAVNDLKARTGLNVTLDPEQVADPLRKVTCETGDLPVWEAVEAFCKAAGLREVFVAEVEVARPPQPTVRSGRRSYYTPPPPPPTPDAVPVLLADGQAAPLPGSRSTAVRVLALPRSFPGNRVTLGTGEVTLNFDVAPAPGLNWQEVTGVRITKVIDDAGRPGAGGTPKEPEPAGGPSDVQVFGPGRVVLMGGWDFEGQQLTPASYPNPRVIPVPVKLATPAARSLKSLEGVVVAEVVIPNQTLISIDDPAKQSGTTVDGPNGTRLTVMGIQDSGKGTQATMRVQLEAPSQWGAQRRFNPWGPMWPEPMRPGLGSQVQAIDANGKVLHAMTTQASDDGVRVVSVLQFNLPRDNPSPSKVLLVGPRPVVVEIPFKMENVPLP